MKLILRESQHAWNTDAFDAALQEELQRLDRKYLPLERATTQGGYIGDDDIRVMPISHREDDSRIRAKAGVFFTEIVINCGCGDEPYEAAAYCELEIVIDRATGEATITLADDVH